MDATLRLMFELTGAAGTGSDGHLDTAEQETPLVYQGLTARMDTVLQIGPAVTDQNVAIPEACVVIVLSDEPIGIRLAAAETLVITRLLVLGSPDEETAAIAAGNLKVSGNTVGTATVRVIALDKVD